MSMKCIPPHTPLLYSKNGVNRGIPIFLIFDPKHRLWVLVRTASGFIQFVSDSPEFTQIKSTKIKFIPIIKFLIFTGIKICIFHGFVFVMDTMTGIQSALLQQFNLNLGN